jgi:transposase-like protein
MVIHVVVCRFCESENVIRHGRTRSGHQRYRCHGCQRTFQEDPGSAAHPEALQKQVLAAYQERVSLRGISRLFGLSRNTVKAWLKKSPIVASSADNADRTGTAGRAGTG